jgi:hypothetical protein
LENPNHPWNLFLLTEEAEHLWMEDEKEVRTLQHQQAWEPLRPPGRFKEIMTALVVVGV